MRALPSALLCLGILNLTGCGNGSPSPGGSAATTASATVPGNGNTPQPAVAAEAPVLAALVIPPGANLEVRNQSAIDSRTAAPGQTYAGVVARDVMDSEGRVAIPRGSDATLVVRDVSDQGRIKGRSELVLDVGSVAIGGRTYRLDTSNVVEQGKPGVGENKRTGEFVGGGSALGGIIGALAGGGKGAAVGALSGAAAGTAAQAMTRGEAVRVPPETSLSFRLEAPVNVREIR